MATKAKIILSASRDIPFDKLVLSQANVRCVKAGVSIEELAEDIARRGLLQGLSVRAVVGADGAPTGMFEIPAGGRRYRALQHLVKTKRMAKTTPVPCIVRETGLAEEDSLAENVQRLALHPLDQFRAFQRLREKGESEEEIAAAFFVPVSVVKQRLKLASVSEKLLDIYAEDGMTLDQLMAFTVSGDHQRQEAVFERLRDGYDKQPYMIRRLLTETAVRASDKRARFIGIDAYVEAGGCVMRDLFQSDEGGWLQDASLVDLMVAEKLRDEAQAVRGEGWKWIEVAPDFPYGHCYGLRELRGHKPELTPDEQAARAALVDELDEIEQAHAGPDDLPEEVDARLGEIEAALEGFDNRPVTYHPDDIARAGAFVSIDGNGQLKVARGFVRPEDEPPVAPPVVEPASGQEAGGQAEQGYDDGQTGSGDDGLADGHADAAPISSDDDDHVIRPLSDRLMIELTSHRTLGLRRALGDRPGIAFLAVVHALAIQTFYLYPLDSCVELRSVRRGFGNVPGLADSDAASAIADRHERLGNLLPAEPGGLWPALLEMDRAGLGALLAHCVAETVNAVDDPYERRPRALAHADQLATAVGLDMAAEGWRPTVDTYLGRITKAGILAAVGQAAGSDAAERIAHLKRADMADAAEALLDGTGWLPVPLRTAGLETPTPESVDHMDGVDGADRETVDVIGGNVEADVGETPSSADEADHHSASQVDAPDDADPEQDSVPLAIAAE